MTFILYLLIVINVRPGANDAITRQQFSTSANLVSNGCCLNENNIDSIEISEQPIFKPENVVLRNEKGENEETQNEFTLTPCRKVVPSLHHTKGHRISDSQKETFSGTTAIGSRGLIQTIRMDLQPERDNFLLLKTSSSGGDFMRDAQEMLFSTTLPFLMQQYPFVMNKNDNNNVDKSLHQIAAVNHGWHERLYVEVKTNNIVAS